MNAYDLMDVIGHAQDAYVLDAEDACRDRKGKAAGKRRSLLIRNLAAAVAILLACFLFLQTPVGAAAVEVVKEQVTKLIETLFPPKALNVPLEGDPLSIPHEAQGREPEETTPGFAIYVDTKSYTMTEEDGVYYIRPIRAEQVWDREEIRRDQENLIKDLSPQEQEAAIDRRIQELEDFNASLPRCEMEIREVPDKAPLDLAEETRQRMIGSWDTVKEIFHHIEPVHLSFYASGGQNWDSPQEEHCFFDNGKQGSFHIILRYFLEAAEGHGTRFNAMLYTFTLIAPQDASGYTGTDALILEATRQQIAFTREQCSQLQEEMAGLITQLDMNDNAQQRYELWLDMLDKLWSALEQTYTHPALSGLLAQQLDWSVDAAAELQSSVAQVSGGSMAPLVYGETGAALVEQRVDALLPFLSGDIPLPQGLAAVPDPGDTVLAFADSYFHGDTTAMASYLSRDYPQPPEVYPAYGGTVTVNAVKGLDTVVKDMARYGRLSPSVEFRASSQSDAFLCLSITLLWEQGQWRVTSYGLEG